MELHRSGNPLAMPFFCLLRKYRILPYLNGNHTFNTPMVAMAVTTGLEPATSSVTDWRSNQRLSYGTI